MKPLTGSELPAEGMPNEIAGKCAGTSPGSGGGEKIPRIPNQLRPRLKSIRGRFPFLKDYHVKLLSVFSRFRSMRPRRIFEQSPASPQWLSLAELEVLQQSYPFPSDYGYDSETVKMRGDERAAEIRSIIAHVAGRRNGTDVCLELGCWDAMVSCALQQAGKTTTAIDFRTDGFDPRALEQGVALSQMDAASLAFRDEHFDFVFSYDAFEHFTNPEEALKEAIRVVRTGGYIYLVFGPLYTSPYGLHAYRSITVPYCQFLFPKEMLRDFSRSRGLEEIDFNQVNGWSLKDYRALWNTHSSRLQKIQYREIPDPSHLELIVKYPSCFKSKTSAFDNLIVSTIEVLFKKTQ